MLQSVAASRGCRRRCLAPSSQCTPRFSFAVRAHLSSAAGLRRLCLLRIPPPSVIGAACAAKRRARQVCSSTPRDEPQCVAVGQDVSCLPEEMEECSVAAAQEEELDCRPARPPLPASPVALARLVAPFFLWGTSMVCLKALLPSVGHPGLSPLFLASCRLIPSGALLVAFSAARGLPAPATAGAWGAVALFALVDGTVFQGCLAQGLTTTSSGLGSVIIDTQPVSVALLSVVLFGERLGGRGVAGLALGVAGLCVLEAGGPSGSGWAEGVPLAERGELWMLTAAQAMAVGTLMVRLVCGVHRVNPVVATGWHMLLGGLPLLAASVAREPELYTRLAAEGLPLGETGALAYASLLGGAVAYAAFFSSASEGNLVRLSSLTFLTPVFAAAAGFVVLGENLTAQQGLGAVIALAGIAFISGGEPAAADSQS